MMNPFKKIIAWDLNRKQAELKKKVERFHILLNQLKSWSVMGNYS